MVVSQEEIAASIIQPHFDGARNFFAKFIPETDTDSMMKLLKVRFIIDPDIHNTPRHFAATRDDGLLMLFAPEIVNLPVETLDAIIAHEFGHAADFAFPGRWITPPDGSGEGSWIPEEEIDTRPYRKWKRMWNTRSRDQIEWAADSIARAVTGMRLGYTGDCLLQSFDRGISRPKGLR